VRGAFLILRAQYTRLGPRDRLSTTKFICSGAPYHIYFVILGSTGSVSLGSVSFTASWMVKLSLRLTLPTT